MSLETIARMIGVEPPAVTMNVPGWSIDSRTIAPGDCFFALRGPTHDGHDFLASVFERGATVAIVDRETRATRATATGAGYYRGATDPGP